jgi:lipoate-protein ligase A
VSEVEDLYDYSELRGTAKATMFVAHVDRPTLVLGGSQSVTVVNSNSLGPTELRRRRGGGGLVLLGPNDLWVDWWIPAGDPRWHRDVHTSSIQVGRWWAATLQNHTDATVSVHEGPLSGNPEFRVVCFAGRGPGEVFVNDRKAVGVTQWRVREGVFLSTVLQAGPTANVLAYLADAPDGLGKALDHQAVSSLHFDDPVSLVNQLDEISGPWDRREILLSH